MSRRPPRLRRLQDVFPRRGVVCRPPVLRLRPMPRRRLISPLVAVSHTPRFVSLIPHSQRLRLAVRRRHGDPPRRLLLSHLHPARQLVASTQAHSDLHAVVVHAAQAATRRKAPVALVRLESAVPLVDCVPLHIASDLRDAAARRMPHVDSLIRHRQIARPDGRASLLRMVHLLSLERLRKTAECGVVHRRHAEVAPGLRVGA